MGDILQFRPFPVKPAKALAGFIPDDDNEIRKLKPTHNLAEPITADDLPEDKPA